ncbi:hypothetical protein PanWU01x14_318520 [Parasponia andersonii]|uniref:Uncharacterized protein n=1 Tax=Parasponia andersonii TaxID=3476 RepID=A0A2P5AMC4_PARAD|nr:hypothetical protein PanWU01x14_318520 [Parasponia andersonii]
MRKATFGKYCHRTDFWEVHNPIRGTLWSGKGLSSFRKR